MNGHPHVYSCCKKLEALKSERDELQHFFDIVTTERDQLKARVERLTKVLAYVEGALASSEEPWLREAHQVIKQALAKGDDSLAEQEGKV